MKKGWQIKSLGEICDILDSKRKPITQRHRIAGKYPYYGATGILDYVHDYIFNEKLILIGEDGAKWGQGEKTAFIAEGKYWVNNHAHVIRPHRNILIDNWLIYFLNFSDLSTFVTGLTVPKLNQEKMRSIPLPLPPLPEQKRIVAILDEAFAHIDKAKANAEKNLENVRELFESYLQNVFANPGEDWEEVKLSTMALYISDGDHMPPPKAENGIPFITISNINKTNYQIDFSNTFTVSAEYFQKLKANRIPQKGDVLYTVTGSYGIPVLIDSDKKFCFQRHIGLIRPKENVNSKWLFYWILSPSAMNQANETATGTAQKTVSLTALRNFMIPKMSLKIQNSIVQKLDSISLEIKKLESIYQQKTNALDELKKSILQKAFSGELKTTDKRVLV